MGWKLLKLEDGMDVWENGSMKDEGGGHWLGGSVGLLRGLKGTVPRTVHVLQSSSGWGVVSGSFERDADERHCVP